MLHLLSPLVVCGECPESGSSGLGVTPSTGSRWVENPCWEKFLPSVFISILSCCIFFHASSSLFP